MLASTTASHGFGHLREHGAVRGVQPLRHVLHQNFAPLLEKGPEKRAGGVVVVIGGAGAAAGAGAGSG